MRSEDEIQRAIEQIQASDLSGESILVSMLEWVLEYTDEPEKPVYAADLVLMSQGKDISEVSMLNGDVLELEGTPFAVRVDDIRLEESTSWDDVAEAFGEYDFGIE